MLNLITLGNYIDTLDDFWFTENIFCFGLIWVFSLNEPPECYTQTSGLWFLLIFCSLLACKKISENENSKRTEEKCFFIDKE